MAVKAHGMNGSLSAADWPALTLDELRILLRNFSACGKVHAILSVSPRPFSAASMVATDSGRIFVKRHHGRVRDRAGLMEEHRFLAYLWHRGASVPRVLRGDDGESAIECGEWTYEVHEPAPGVDAYQDAHSWTPFRSTVHAQSAGEALARLHVAAQAYDAPARENRPLVAGFSIFASGDPAYAMDRYIAARPVLMEYMAGRRLKDRALRALLPFYQELQPLLASLLPLWTHNDLHASNLLWSDERSDAQAVAVIDFGLADRTNAVHDLAQAIERNIIEWLILVEHPASPEDVPVHLDHLEALLAGYESVRPLSAAEARALAPMTALCHAEFALSETDYFLSALHAPEKAPLAADGWMVGHAEWFHTRRGTELLNFLRKWAQRWVHA